MAYMPPSQTRQRDDKAVLRGPWTALGPLGRLLAWPVAILLGWPSALGFLASLFCGVLFLSMGKVTAGVHSLIGAAVCAVLVTIAFAPLNALRR